MRRISIWMMSTISTLVLIFSYHTSTSSSSGTGIVAASTNTGGISDPSVPATPTPSPSTSSSPTPSDSATPAPAGESASPTPSEATPSTGAGGTFLGNAVQTRYGPVQVQITVAGGKITKSVVTQVPWNDRKDQQINSYAVPILNQETVAAQNASIDMVSGATYTSQGYMESLQSAIDQAHL